MNDKSSIHLNFSGYTENHLRFLLQRFPKTFFQDFCIYLNFKSLQHPHTTSIWSSTYVCFSIFLAVTMQDKAPLDLPKQLSYYPSYCIFISLHPMPPLFSGHSEQALDYINSFVIFFLVSSDNKFRMMQLEIRRQRK